MRFAATQAVIALLVDGARLAVYGAAFILADGAVATIPWPLVGIVTLAAFSGSFVGKRLLTKVTRSGLHRLIGGLLLAIGAFNLF